MKYLKRARSNTRFQDNGDGTVTDIWYNRVWLKNPKTEFPNKMTHDEALEVAQSCDVGGFNDWELPTANELALMLDHNHHNPCLPPDSPFTIHSDLYWGSDKHAQRFFDGWYVSFYQGFVINEMSGRDKGYVWPMRRYNWSDFPDEDRFIDHFDGTVTDTWTGLMWVKDPSAAFPHPLPQGEAIEAARSCDVGGYNDWHLRPSTEMVLLMDYDEIFPALHKPNPFVVETTERFYWSLNTYVGPHPSGQRPDGWGIYLRDGQLFNAPKDNSSFAHYVWPARIA